MLLLSLFFFCLFCLLLSSSPLLLFLSFPFSHHGWNILQRTLEFQLIPPFLFPLLLFHPLGFIGQYFGDVHLALVIDGGNEQVRHRVSSTRTPTGHLVFFFSLGGREGGGGGGHRRYRFFPMRSMTVAAVASTGPMALRFLASPLDPRHTHRLLLLLLVVRLVLFRLHTVGRPA